MKFCTNCGKQVEDNAAVCPFCGTALGGGARPAMGFAQGGAKAGGLSLPKILMLAGGALAFIATFMRAISVSASAFGMSISEGISFVGLGQVSGFGGFLGIFALLLTLALVAVVVVDAFVKPLGMIPLILGAVEVVWCVILFIYLLVQRSSALGEMGDLGDYLGDMVSVHLGFGFWLFLIGSIAVGVGTVMSFMNKKR